MCVCADCCTCTQTAMFAISSAQDILVSHAFYETDFDHHKINFVESANGVQYTVPYLPSFLRPFFYLKCQPTTSSQVPAFGFSEKYILKFAKLLSHRQTEEEILIHLSKIDSVQFLESKTHSQKQLKPEPVRVCCIGSGQPCICMYVSYV